MTSLILIVEDDSDLRAGLQELLTAVGHEVVVATDGLDGLSVLKNGKSTPNIIVSDLMMPNMDGCQFFREVRSSSQWENIPFIFTSGSGHTITEKCTLNEKKDRIIDKPFDVMTLVTAIQQISA